MAEQSSHDVVNKALSVDDPSSADVSATQNPATVARAAPEKATSVSSTDFVSTTHDLLPSQPELTHESAEAYIDLKVGSGGEGATDTTYTFDAQQLSPHDIPKINGIPHDHESLENEATEEGSVKSAGADGSLGSDTDTGKVEQAKDLGEGQKHSRPYVVKKSASFKPVSVTKSFLAKAGATPVATLKASGDKVNGTVGLASAAEQAAPRPRLVAKSASGLRSLAPKALSTVSKAGKVSGPDPNQVWNRNRATPQATPKHLTDEELRQQYGIQLASRPQEDGDGKEAKWADIDDDEDDWVPETIEWNDGTKINLAQIDHNAAIAEQAAAAAAKEREEEAAKQKLLATKLTTSVGPNATVLKLGSASQPKAGGLVLKGPSEKPTLVSKPSSNAVKSPWASLPPVDKASPIPISPTTQTSASRFAQIDSHGFESMPPQPPPTKEIAADDFSRFLRDTQNSNPRELFNSQSGRYEPVNENRRGSLRKEQSFRPPAVLQRPSHGDVHTPAEPSAAFQARGSGQESGSWSRRRASSNLSGESGNFGRRSSLGKGFDSFRMSGDARQRRDSHNDQSPLTPGLSSVQSQGQSVASQSPTVPQYMSASGSISNSPHPTQAVPVQASAQSVVPAQDAVAAQKILMREKREAAIRRKQEEEAKEEAAKKERIRLKMETLGLTDEKMGKKLSGEVAPPSPVIVLKETKETLPANIPQSPPKPPLPNATGQPQQYGMMKVHAPHTLHGSTQTPTSMDKKLPDAPSDISDVKSGSKTETPTSLTNGITVQQEPVDLFVTRSPQARQQELATAAKPHTWSDVQPSPSSFPNWHTNGMTTHSTPGGNLWGSPSNHRALGNGDFQQSVQTPQMRQGSYPQHVLSQPPQPIGPPKTAQQGRVSQVTGKLPDNATRSTKEEFQTIPTFPVVESTQARHSLNPPQSKAFASNKPDHRDNSASGPGLAPRMPHIEPPKPKAGVAAWASFSANVVQHDAERNEVSKREYEAAKVEAVRSGAALEPRFNETWRQTQRGDELGARSIVNVTKTQQYVQPLNQVEQITVETLRPANAGHAGPQVRSRYQDIFEQNKRTNLPATFPRSASPTAPPPDSADHPAYFSVTQRPLVNLPGSKPKLAEKPIVRLPPPQASGSPREALTSLTSSKSPLTPLRAASQPLVHSSSWQDRFNGLFDRKGNPGNSPEEKFADVVDFSTSKVPLELVMNNNPAAVTLPPQDDIESAQIVVKIEQPMKNIEDEDALFENRDFGSVPTVRIPHKAPVEAWNPPPKVYRAQFQVLTDFDIASVAMFLPGITDAQRNSGLQVTIRMNGMLTPRTKTLPRISGLSSPRPHHANTNRGKPRNGHHKAKDPSSTHSSSKGSPRGGSEASAPTSSHQQARPKGNSGNTTWARRVSGVAQ